MRYYWEEIMRIFWPGNRIKANMVFLQQLINQTKEIKAKEKKVSYTVTDKCNIGTYFDVYTYINKWKFPVNWECADPGKIVKCPQVKNL